MRAIAGNMWNELADLRREVDAVRMNSQSTTASTAAMILTVREEVRQDAEELVVDQNDLGHWVNQLHQSYPEIGEAVIGVQHGVIDHHHELVSARGEIQALQQEVGCLRMQMADIWRRLDMVMSTI